MKLLITQKGVFVPDGEKGKQKELDVGEVLKIEGDEIPAPLVGKCEDLDKKPKEPVEVKNEKEKK